MPWIEKARNGEKEIEMPAQTKTAKAKRSKRGRPRKTDAKRAAINLRISNETREKIERYAKYFDHSMSQQAEIFIEERVKQIESAQGVLLDSIIENIRASLAAVKAKYGKDSNQDVATYFAMRGVLKRAIEELPKPVGNVSWPSFEKLNEAEAKQSDAFDKLKAAIDKNISPFYVAAKNNNVSNKLTGLNWREISALNALEAFIKELENNLSQIGEVKSSHTISYRLDEIISECRKSSNGLGELLQGRSEPVKSSLADSLEKLLPYSANLDEAILETMRAKITIFDEIETYEKGGIGAAIERFTPGGRYA